MMDDNKFIQYVRNCTEIFYDEPDPEAALRHATALVARAEAAEAERNELRERHDNLKNAHANLVEEAAERLVRMYAAERRVAELEAALAAQQWRPVTEEWPHYAERVAIGHVAGNWAAIATRVQSPDDDEWELEDGKMLDWESASVAIELPPLPQEPPQ